MIDRILEFSLRQRTVVVLGAIALLVAGLWSATHLPIDAVPDITGVQVQINTEVPSLAAEESEKLVTQPIEQELAGLPGVEEMRSLTKFGLSQVTLQFKDGTDIYRARQLVAERLQGIADRLPPGASSRLAPISTGLGEIFYFSLHYRPDAPDKPATEREQLIALGELQEYVVKPLLRTVPGIAEINSIGGHEKQFVIQPKPAALTAAGLTFSELAGRVAENVENAGGGIINRDREQLTIRAVSRVMTIADIAELPLKFGGGVKPLLVRDVAEVKIGTRFRTGAATRNGHEVVIGSTMMLVGENGGEVARRVRARLEEIQAALDRRKKRNAGYSLRAFARDLGISPSLLNEVLQGKHGLSQANARKIANRLGYPSEAVSRFCDRVAVEHARKASDREAAAERLARIPGKTLDLDQFEVIVPNASVAKAPERRSPLLPSITVTLTVPLICGPAVPPFGTVGS